MLNDDGFFDPAQEHMDSQPSTLAELIRDQMSFEGRQVPEQAWILSDYDTWERNPHYNGPANPRHPEEDNEHEVSALPPPAEGSLPGVPFDWDADAARRNADWEKAMKNDLSDDIGF